MINNLFNYLGNGGKYYKLIKFKI